MNPVKMMKITAAWQKFQNTHPKFAKFIREVPQQTFMEGTVLEITVTTEDGRKYCSNMKITESDMALFRELRDMRN